MLPTSPTIMSHPRTVGFFTLLTILCLVCCDKPSATGVRIVSLSPAMTEVIYALHAETTLVGVTTVCDYPAAARDKPAVGDFSNPSLERIMARHPTLVIVHLPEQRRIKEQLEKLNAAVFVSSTRSLDDLYKEIQQLGALLNRTEQAESLIRGMKTELTPASPIRRPRVYVELSPRPLITIGTYSFLHELIELAGGENIFSDLKQDYPIVQQEEIIRRDPEIILVLHPVAFGTRAGWDNVDALRNDRVYVDLNQDHLMRPGPRLVQGYRTLKELFSE